MTETSFSEHFQDESTEAIDKEAKATLPAFFVNVILKLSGVASGGEATVHLVTPQDIFPISKQDMTGQQHWFYASGLLLLGAADRIKVTFPNPDNYSWSLLIRGGATA